MEKGIHKIPKKSPKGTNLCAFVEMSSINARKQKEDIRTLSFCAPKDREQPVHFSFPS